MPSPAVNQIIRSASYVGPGDILPGATYWWGLRAYNRAYANSLGNCVDVIRASDSAVQTFRVLKNGSLDVGAVAGFLRGTTGKVTKLWDQSGTGNHLAQGTDASRPAFTINGGNGLPSLTFAGAQFMAAPSKTVIDATTQTSVAKRTGSFSDNSAVFGSDVFDTIIFFAAADTAKIYANAADLSATAADSVWHTINGVFTADGTNSSITVDGATTTGAIGANPFGDGFPQIGQATGSSFPLTGDIREVGVWNGNFNAAIARINANQRAHWRF